jgi:hypothetical protein
MLGDFIKIAKVASIKDPTKSGIINCLWPQEKDISKVFPVQYTTPFYSPPAGNENSEFAGMYAVPTEGTFVLVARAWNGMDWFYISSIPGDPTTPEKTIPSSITGVSQEAYENTLPANELTALSDRPWGVSVKSSGGAQLQMNDGASKEDLGWRTLLQSMTKKILIMADNSDFQAFNNQHGDGLKLAGDEYEGINGPESGELSMKGNMFLHSQEGSLSIAVEGGDSLDIENWTPNYNKLNPNEGQICLCSYSNSVNISTKGVSEPIQNPLLPKGIFIDASNYGGVVQIRTGVGGLEVFSAGHINFNCGGDFNINAKGHVNISAGSTLSQSWTGSPLEPPGMLGLVELNPVNPVGLTPLQKTLNNEEQFPTMA